MAFRCAGRTRVVVSRVRRIERGNLYWIDPNPVAGREMRNRHPFVVITPAAINALGLVMAVPVTSGGAFAQARGLTVPLQTKQLAGVAVCNQVRTFDLSARVKNGSAKFVAQLDSETAEAIVSRILSVIDPAP
jgi:mRNA interferase ChpB